MWFEHVGIAGELGWLWFEAEGQRKGKRVQKEVEIHDIDHAIMEWHNICLSEVAPYCLSRNKGKDA